MSLTQEQLAIREKIMQYTNVIPDNTVSIDTVLSVLILDELQTLRSLITSVINPAPTTSEEDN